MKKYLVGFAVNGRIIYRVAEGNDEGDARINARNKHWSEFKKSVLEEDEEPKKKRILGCSNCGLDDDSCSCDHPNLRWTDIEEN